MKKRQSKFLLSFTGVLTLGLMGCLSGTADGLLDPNSNRSSDLKQNEQELYRQWLAEPYAEIEDFTIYDSTAVADTLFPDSAYCEEFSKNMSSGNKYFYYEGYKDEPIYVSYEEFAKAFKTYPEQDLKNTGKIYQYKTLRFVNEVDKGVHVYETNDTDSMVYKTFFRIPGNREIAIRNGILYADSYTHLVVIDVKNPAQIKLLSVQAKVFTNYDYYYGYDQVDNEGRFLLGIRRIPVIYKYCGGLVFESPDQNVIMTTDDFEMAPQKESVEGKAGSMTRFAFGEKALYFADQQTLHTFSLQSPEKPKRIHSLSVDWGIETLFDGDSVLYLGSQTGTYLVDISDELKPILASSMQHARSCDPIVTEGNYAYVTLSSGWGCWNGSNELLVLDVSDIKNPELLISHEMTQPRGLFVENSILYLCDGTNGLEIYDVSSYETLKLIGAEKSHPCNDLIKDGNEIFAFGDWGAMTFDVSDLKKPLLTQEIEGNPENYDVGIWGEPEIFF